MDGTDFFSDLQINIFKDENKKHEFTTAVT